MVRDCLISINSLSIIFAVSRDYFFWQEADFKNYQCLSSRLYVFNTITKKSRKCRPRFSEHFGPIGKIQPDLRHTGLKDGQKVMMIGTAEDEAAAFQSKDVGVRGVVRGGDAQPAKGLMSIFPIWW